MKQKQILKCTDYYQIITGILTELEVFDTQAQFFKSRKLAGLAPIGLLALGDVAAAASQLSTADDNEEGMAYLNSVQYFRCKIGACIIEGTFCRVFFTNGDKVEVVVEPEKDGSYFAYALRRPIDHRLWLHPWATKGTKSINKTVLKFTGVFISLCFILSMAISVAVTSEYLYLLIFFVSAIVFHFLFGAICYFLAKNIFGQGSKEADKIFATLGYPDPKSVDMEKEFYEFYSYLDESDPNFYVDITTEQYQQQTPEGAKWVTFYREAPPIPDYITVINAGLQNNEAKTYT
ncbi:putative type VI secretion system effector [Orbus sturtevantii]|uniref:putative type VI secretion system effector n=1 Tax=Orbus sturtevantii TaxID=3074109 RepID=UPI00370D6C50